jgi:hypothetical protein
MSGVYKCLTNQGYGECNLGRFFGTKTVLPTELFSMNWETVKEINVPRNGRYKIEFFVFYNCYQKKGLFDFFKSDCSDVLDRLTIYSKTPTGLYQVVTQYDLDKSISMDSWKAYSHDLQINTDSLYVFNNNLLFSVLK